MQKKLYELQLSESQLELMYSALKLFVSEWNFSLEKDEIEELNDLIKMCENHLEKDEE